MSTESVIDTTGGPNFGRIPVMGSSAVSATADTSYTAPAVAVTLLGAQSPRQVTDGVTTSGSTTVTSATLGANSGDIGRPISHANLPTGTYITKVASATSVTVSQPATASGTGLTLTLGGGIGTQVLEYGAIGIGTTTAVLAGEVNLFTYDGTTYHLEDQFTFVAGSGSTTAAQQRFATRPPYLLLPPGWLLVATSMVASQLVSAFGRGINF